MNISVISTAQQCNDFNFSGQIAVVIDVLRATSVITTALDNGAKSVIPVKTVEEAEQVFSALPEGSALKGGERHSVKIEGFDLDNSPLKYKRKTVEGKDIILTTTNGTNAINNVRQAEKIVLACFRNLDAVADYLIESQKDISIVCSGTEGRFSLDDGLCAGMLIHLLKAKTKCECDDLGILLERSYQSSANNLFAALTACFHVKRLFALGFYDDLKFCLETNCVKTIPILNGNKIIALR